LCGAGVVLAAHTAQSHAALPRVPAEAKPSAGAEVVTVGMYVTRIHELNFRENYFTAEIYVWFRWWKKSLEPYKSFSLVHAREIESKAEPFVTQLPDGQHYAYVKMVAKISHFWDVTEYPLDRHDLTVAIEEDSREDHLIRYDADHENSGSDKKSISIPGWALVATSTKADVHKYLSNFGDTSIPTNAESRYGRFGLTMHFTREGTLYFMKLFFGIWVAAGISFLAFFIRPQDVDPRFGVGVAAIFAAVASWYVITASLPDTNVITLADKLIFVTFVFVFGTVMQSTWSLHLVENDREAVSRTADRLARWAFPLAYVAVNALIILFR
jgi:hypothetical protein